MNELIELIKQKSFRRGLFTLASGKTSEYFFDLKPTMLDPLGSIEIAARVLDIIHDHPCDAIGGMAIGAVPIVAVTVALSGFTDRPVPGFYVRKEVKDHGTGNLIDGLDVKDREVILVEDVTTSGGSLLKAAEAVRDAGGRVSYAVTVIDRAEGGADNLFAHGIRLLPIFVRSDFD